jgi:CheY-like chemotaxis protein
VSDIGLPGEDGHALIRRVRARGDRTPAMAVTAHARAEERRAVLLAGFQMHVAKPMEPADLVAAVATLGRTAQSTSP